MACSLAVLLREIGSSALPQSDPRISLRKRAATPKISTDWDQARGGARDWNAKRRGSMMTDGALRTERSTHSKPTGTGNSGASGVNDVEARKIVAQIAQ